MQIPRGRSELHSKLAPTTVASGYVQFADAGILLLQSGDKRVLTAASEIVRKGLATVTLLGEPEAVAQDADRLGLDLSGIEVIDHMVRSHVLLLAVETSCKHACCTC